MEATQEETITSLGNFLREIKEKLESIQKSVKSAEEVLQRLEDATLLVHQHSLSGEIKFSKAAKKAIEYTQGPLPPEVLQKFLMEDTFSKPKPYVLPICRKYTKDADELINQLLCFKNEYNKAHMRYKEQRILDICLNKRIDTLVANMRKELEIETTVESSKKSMYQYLIRQGP